MECKLFNHFVNNLLLADVTHRLSAHSSFLGFNMKNIIFILFAATITISLSGCVPTTYTKTVTVTKDANGRVVGSVESEQVIQPGQQGHAVTFDHLKGVTL